MTFQERLLLISKYNKKDLKNFVREYEWNEYVRNLDYFKTVCQNLKLVRLKIYETTKEQHVFETSPRIEKIYSYDLDSNAITFYLVGNKYSQEEVISKNSHEHISFINSNFDDICKFIFNKQIKMQCSDWDRFIHLH